MEVLLSALFGNYDRQTNRPTNKQMDIIVTLLINIGIASKFTTIDVFTTSLIFSCPIRTNRKLILRVAMGQQTSITDVLKRRIDKVICKCFAPKNSTKTFEANKSPWLFNTAKLPARLYILSQFRVYKVLLWVTVSLITKLDDWQRQVPETDHGPQPRRQVPAPPEDGSAVKENIDHSAYLEGCAALWFCRCYCTCP